MQQGRVPYIPFVIASFKLLILCPLLLSFTLATCSSHHCKIPRNLNPFLTSAPRYSFCDDYTVTNSVKWSALWKKIECEIISCSTVLCGLNDTNWNQVITRSRVSYYCSCYVIIMVIIKMSRL